MSLMIDLDEVDSMKIADIMSTSPVVLAPEQTIREASQVFLDHQIDGAPVVDEHGQMVGLVTKSHIYQVLAQDGDPDTPIQALMKEAVIIGRPDDRVRDLIRTSVGRLPVIEHNQVVGMVTRTDLARAYFDSFNYLSKELQAILDSTHNLIISVDREGRINLLNRAAEEFLHLKSSEVRGLEIIKVIPNSGLMEILETRRSRPVQKITLNNSLFISNRTPIIEDGQMVGAVAVLQDISELESISR